jgi:hypothetical protein
MIIHSWKEYEVSWIWNSCGRSYSICARPHQWSTEDPKGPTLNIHIFIYGGLRKKCLYDIYWEPPFQNAFRRIPGSIIWHCTLYSVQAFQGTVNVVPFKYSLFVYFSYFTTYIHSVTFIQYIYPSPFTEVSLHLLIACKLSRKNLPVVPSRESGQNLS